MDENLGLDPENDSAHLLILFQPKNTINMGKSTYFIGQQYK